MKILAKILKQELSFYNKEMTEQTKKELEKCKFNKNFKIVKKTFKHIQYGTKLEEYILTYKHYIIFDRVIVDEIVFDYDIKLWKYNMRTKLSHWAEKTDVYKTVEQVQKEASEYWGLDLVIFNL